jgi:hypothetical protein
MHGGSGAMISVRDPLREQVRAAALAGENGVSRSPKWIRRDVLTAAVACGDAGRYAG